MRDDVDIGFHPRQPPSNLELESALLGAVLVNNRAHERVAEFLRAEHFYDPVHARIYDAICKLLDRGTQASPATLRHYLEQDEVLAQAGGARYLAELAAAALDIIDAEAYGRSIHELFVLREVHRIGEDAVVSALRPDLDEPALGLVERVSAELFDLTRVDALGPGYGGIGRGVQAALAAAAEAFRQDGRVVGTATGLADLDRALGGLKRQELVIFGGRPSMGKSGLALCIARNAALTGAHVALQSLEMSEEQLGYRMLALATGIPISDQQDGRFGASDFDRLAQASRDMAELPLQIDETGSLTLATLRARLRALARRRPLDLVVIDYLQLLRGAGGQNRAENRVQEISEITRGLKALAKELDVPVVALSQLSRAVEQREDKRPQLADLRDSGAIEQDADVVMFVYREEYYVSRTAPPAGASQETVSKHLAALERCSGLAEVIVAKARQRQAPTVVKLAFDQRIISFANLARSL